MRRAGATDLVMAPRATPMAPLAVPWSSRQAIASGRVLAVPNRTRAGQREHESETVSTSDDSRRQGDEAAVDVCSQSPLASRVTHRTVRRPCRSAMVDQSSDVRN